MGSKHQVLIVGGGTAGITTAAHLLKRNRKLDVAIVDPAEWHYYQPCLLYTSPSPRDATLSRMPSSA